MAVAAFKRRDHVIGGLPRRLSAVVTNDTKSCHRQWNLRVIDSLRRVPAHHGVAGRAIITGSGVSGAFALRHRAVVTAHAATEHLSVVEVHLGTERDGVVARRAIVRARDVRRCFWCRIEGRTGHVADAAIARRTFEYRVQMARLARQIAMHSVKFEAGREMVEWHRNWRRLGNAKPRP